MLSKSLVALVAVLAASPASVSPAQPANFGAATYMVSLTGNAEVAGLAGDQDGSGRVMLTVDPDARRICYDFSVSHLATPLMAHIHRAPAQQTGPSVVTLFTGPGGELSDCLMWTEKWLTEIVAHPADFYINLYTTEYPDGAIRGQLVG